jgi:hypothetical protein
MLSFFLYCAFQIVSMKFQDFPSCCLRRLCCYISIPLSPPTSSFNCLSYSVFLSETLSSSLCPPETHNQRQAALHDYLPTPRLLGDGTERKKHILYWTDQSSQGRTKISCTCTTSPANQPRKDPFYLYSLSPPSP